MLKLDVLLKYKMRKDQNCHPKGICVNNKLRVAGYCYNKNPQECMIA